MLAQALESLDQMMAQQSQASQASQAQAQAQAQATAPATRDTVISSRANKPAPEDLGDADCLPGLCALRPADGFEAPARDLRPGTESSLSLVATIEGI